MTNEERKVFELALEALQDYVDEHGPWSDDSGAQYVLRVGKEALAQPEQEPVANVVLRDGLPTLLANNQIKPTDERLYTTPPQPEKPDQDEVDIRSRLYQRIHELETQLAQPEQAPVAWLHWLHGPVRLFLNKDEAMLELDRLNREYPMDKDARQMKPVYTTPPQRKPLTDEIKTRTDEQIEATFKRCGGRWNGDYWVIEDADLHPFVRTIEGTELNTLRAISDEYNAWIKHHAAGHSYDDFLANRKAAHNIKE